MAGLEDLGAVKLEDKKSGGSLSDLGAVPVSKSNGTSALRVGAKSALRSTPSALGGLAGAGRGALFGARFGLPGVIVGGLGGGVAGAFLAEKGTELASEAIAPGKLREFDTRLAEETKEHPIAAAVGGSAPLLMGLRPGIPRLPTALIGGGLGAASEVIPAVSQGRPIDPAQVAVRSATGAFLSKPTAFGRKLGIPSPSTDGKGATPSSESRQLPPEMQGRVDRITQSIKEAQPVRVNQELLYTKERSRRMASALSLRQKTSGETGYRAELGQLKGELPKVQFESIRSKINQDDIDGLMNDITANLDFWDSLPAREGVMKMLRGEVPTQGELQLLRSVFGNKLPNQLLQKRTLIQRGANLGIELANLPRSFMAGMIDFSGSLRQGVFLAPRHPILWSKAFASQFRNFASERVFQESQDRIKLRPSYKLMRENGLELTDVAGDFTGREERFMSSLGEKIPVAGPIIKATSRAYVGFLNRLRADVFDDFVKAGIESKVDNPLYLKHAANFVNNATGRGTLRIPIIGSLEGSEALKRSAILLNSTLFSPRLVASRLNLLDPTYYVRLSPEVRKEALKSLFALAGTGTTVLALLKLNGAKVSSDPRNADFGKARYGNTRFDLWGGFQQPIRAAAQVISGKQISSTTGREITLGEGYKPTTREDIIQRFFESKESPIISLAHSFVRGRTSTGEEFKLAPAVVDRFIPMIVSDIYDVSREEGAGSWWKGLPSFFGVGVQTYGKQIPRIEKTQAGAETVKFRGQPSVGETIVNKMTGQQVSNIPEKYHPSLERVREYKLMRDTQVDRAKKIVLETGRPMRVGNTIVYIQRGVLKTKSFGGESKITPENMLKYKLQQKK